MARVLYIECSPRGDASYSTTAARAFLKLYREMNPADDVDEIALWQTDLPNLNGIASDAKYAKLRRVELSAAEQGAWDGIVSIVERFKAADKYVFSVPMWNFTIPHVLKHYIDLIVQPGLTFRKSPEGVVEGLVKGKSALCIFSSGSIFPDGIASPLPDFQRPYMEWILKFIGIVDFRVITISPTISKPEIAQHALMTGLREAEIAARTF
ncbi:FMN-dependent NADH-azoreductase [Microvirga sp. 2YAF29]|uniref:FMN-dependent NADH-azoreductase n=1 Tax=Microvirga sp. 2YAF29 TaxID=3233031 RepID=UPI003F94EC94